MFGKVIPMNTPTKWDKIQNMTTTTKWEKQITAVNIFYASFGRNELKKLLFILTCLSLPLQIITECMHITYIFLYIIYSKYVYYVYRVT